MTMYNRRGDPISYERPKSKATPKSKALAKKAGDRKEERAIISHRKSQMKKHGFKTEKEYFQKA